MPKTGRERKKLGVKKVKKTPKSGREKSKVAVKKSEKWPKKAFTPTFGFHAQKKTLYPTALRKREDLRTVRALLAWQGPSWFNKAREACTQFSQD